MLDESARRGIVSGDSTDHRKRSCLLRMQFSRVFGVKLLPPLLEKAWTVTSQQGSSIRG